jgi:hypothetical protein
MGIQEFKRDKNGIETAGDYAFLDGTVVLNCLLEKQGIEQDLNGSCYVPKAIFC